jgi:antitoxin HicB
MRHGFEQAEPFMPSYPAKITNGEDGLVLVTFPDVPEAVICGAGERDALSKAPEILDIVLAGYEAEQRPVPQPSSIPDAPQVARRRIDPALARPVLL